MSKWTSWFRLWNGVVQLTMVAACLNAVVFARPALCQDNDEELLAGVTDKAERQAIERYLANKKLKVAHWQSFLGPVSFKRDDFYRFMLYVGPQPDSAFSKMGDWQTKDYSDDAGSWLINIIRAPLLPDFKEFNPSNYYDHFYLKKEAPQELKPVAFYLGTKEPDYEWQPWLATSDSLEYRWRKGSVGFRGFQNRNSLTIVPEIPNYKPGTPIKADVLASFLVKVFALPANSPEKFIAEFNLPPVLKVGDMFTNAGYIESDTAQTWKDSIVGIVAPDGIRIMILTVVPSPKGFPFMPEWLDLYEADGKKVERTRAMAQMNALKNVRK